MMDRNRGKNRRGDMLKSSGSEAEESVASGSTVSGGGAKGAHNVALKSADKENVNIYEEKFGLSEKKTRQPEGYRRRPLRDITGVLRPSNGNARPASDSLV